jgi:hypothetical protein
MWRNKLLKAAASLVLMHPVGHTDQEAGSDVTDTPGGVKNFDVKHCFCSSGKRKSNIVAALGKPSMSSPDKEST